MFEIANNITGDIQQLCQALWEVTPEGDAVSSDKLKAAMGLIFAREQKSYETFVSLLTDFQLKCLTALAQQDGRRHPIAQANSVTILVFEVHLELRVAARQE